MEEKIWGDIQLLGDIEEGAVFGLKRCWQTKTHFLDDRKSAAQSLGVKDLKLAAQPQNIF